MLRLLEIPKPASLVGRGGFWVQAGATQIHIGTEDGGDRRATRAHLAYQVTDIAVWRAIMEGEDIAVLDGIPIPGYDRFEARDPFGNRIEFIAPLP